jgi:hypothetical protein
MRQQYIYFILMFGILTVSISFLFLGKTTFIHIFLPGICVVVLGGLLFKRFGIRKAIQLTVPKREQLLSDLRLLT